MGINVVLSLMILKQVLLKAPVYSNKRCKLLGG
jgi:hypothetical protein